MTQRFARNAKGRFLRLGKGRFQRGEKGSCTPCCAGCQWCEAAGTAASPLPALVCPPTPGIILTFTGVSILSKSAIESMYPDVAPPPDGFAPAPTISPSTLGAVKLFAISSTAAGYGCGNLFLSEDPVITTTIASNLSDGTGTPRTTESYLLVNYGCGTNTGGVSFGQSAASLTNSIGTGTRYDDGAPGVDGTAGFIIFAGGAPATWARACSRNTGSFTSTVSTSTGPGGINGQTYPVANGGSASVTGTYSPPWCGTCTPTNVVVSMNIVAHVVNASQTIPAFSCSVSVPKVTTPGVVCSYTIDTTIGGYPMRVTLSYQTALNNNLFVGWSARAEYTTSSRPSGVPAGYVYGGDRRCRGSVQSSPLGAYSTGGNDAASNTVTVS